MAKVATAKRKTTFERMFFCDKNGKQTSWRYVRVAQIQWFEFISEGFYLINVAGSTHYVKLDDEQIETMMVE